MTRLRHYLGLACLLTAGGSALAQQSPARSAADDIPEIRRYAVEFIVFRYAEPVAVGTEVFVPDIIEVPPDVPEGFVLDDHGNLVPAPAADADERSDEQTVLTDAELLEDPLEPVFELVITPDEDLELGNYWDAFRRLDVYEPLLHGGWTQTALEEDAVVPVDIREFGVVPDGLSGEFTLYLSRFLHLVVDLELLAPDEEQPVSGNAVATRAPQRRYADAHSGEFTAYRDDRDNREVLYAPLKYRIREDRIFRSDEVRYYDHPKFGVIAKIVRVEEEQPAGDEFPDDTEFLLPPASSTGGH
ncbi:MAG: CsiV family protein [Woeseiaceae bacterium]|nr:CsiV family protein [Woeseiaceae bacterium]